MYTKLRRLRSTMQFVSNRMATDIGMKFSEIHTVKQQLTPVSERCTQISLFLLRLTFMVQQAFFKFEFDLKNLRLTKWNRLIYKTSCPKKNVEGSFAEEHQDSFNVEVPTKIYKATQKQFSWSDFALWCWVVHRYALILTSKHIAAKPIHLCYRLRNSFH